MTNKKTTLPTEHCETCPALTELEQMGIKLEMKLTVISPVRHDRQFSCD